MTSTIHHPPTDPHPRTDAHRAAPYRRAALIGVLAAGLLAVPALATAHVRVSADTTTAGAFAQLTFRVPTESATASTVEVEVELPQDRPLLYVSTKPVPGWTAAVVEAKLPTPVESSGTTITKAVRTVTWTADSAATAIRPGEYQEFSLSAGPLPGAGELLLPATQTYSDRTVVDWDEPPSASGAEPEHPAPVLTVTAAEPAAEPAADTPANPAAATGTADPVARTLGVVGVVLGAVAAVLAALTLRRTRGRPGA